MVRSTLLFISFAYYARVVMGLAVSHCGSPLTHKLHIYFTLDKSAHPLFCQAVTATPPMTISLWTSGQDGNETRLPCFPLRTHARKANGPPEDALQDWPLVQPQRGSMGLGDLAIRIAVTRSVRTSSTWSRIMVGQLPRKTSGVNINAVNPFSA